MAYVYGICSGDGVKIGVSVDWRGRLAGLQIGNPAALVPVFLIPCESERIAYRLEGLLHEWLRPELIRGEWFMGETTIKLAHMLRDGSGAEAREGGEYGA